MVLDGPEHPAIITAAASAIARKQGKIIRFIKMFLCVKIR
jgi:hypothetical protein